MADVHVVGAGPVGSMAAISAIRNNHRVIISEDHPTAGIPSNCSGLFSVDGIGSLRSFVDCRRFIINPINGAKIHLDGQVLSVRKPEPVAQVCDRAAFDRALAAKAEEEGAKINFGERIRGRFHADNIIGADGPLSAVARHFRFRKITRYASTLQALAAYRSAEPSMVEVFVSNSRFPGFFAWVIPHDECTAEFGVGVELPHRAVDAWHRLLRLKKIPAASVQRPKGAVIPLEVRSRTAMRAGRRNVLLAGDAAGQVKATTGGGVIFGGSCAALAGRHATSPYGYELEWRARYGADLSLHAAIHDYLASCSDEALSALGRKLKRLDLDVYLSSHGHMDKPTRMLRPELLTHLLTRLGKSKNPDSGTLF